MPPESKSPMHILHVAETIAGGIASYLRDLLPLQGSAHGSGAITVLIPASQSAHLPLPPGVWLETYDDQGPRALRSVRLAVRMRALLKANGIDVVHIHSTFAGATCRPLLRLMGFRGRVVYCPHGWAFDRDMPGWARWLTILVERALSHWCDAVICISAYERDAALRAALSPSVLRLVRNGVAAHAAPPAGLVVPWRSSAVRLLFVGRFDRQKGLDVFLEALERAGGRGQAAVAGQPVLGDSSGLGERAGVIELGWLGPSQLSAVFSQSDALVVPSRWEGFGLIAAEAMRAGLAVIASRVGGLQEVVLDGVTGRLVPPGDVEALAAVLRELDAATLSEWGRAGRQRFHECFTMERVARELDVVYRGIA